MSTFLITAFEPFGGLPCNPTRRVLEDLAARFWTDTTIIHHAVLPVVFGAAHRRLMEKVHDLRPAILLCLGLDHRTGRSRAIRLETTGRNLAHAAAPDNQGMLPLNQRITPEGPTELQLDWDAPSLRRTLAAHGIAAKVSLDAGGYVCNDLIYRTCRSLQAMPSPPLFGFVHIPWPADCGHHSVCQHRFHSLGQHPESVLHNRGKTPMDVILRAVSILLHEMAESVR